MYIETTNSTNASDTTLSNEDLVSLLITGIDGGLCFHAVVGDKLVEISMIDEIDDVPDQAQYVSLVSSMSEIRGFVVYRSFGAKPVPLRCGPSFEIHSKTGDVAMVFLTDAPTDIGDVLSFFRTTFACEKDSYCLALSLPLLGNGWFLPDEYRNRLRTIGCATYRFDDAPHSSFVLH